MLKKSVLGLVISSLLLSACATDQYGRPRDMNNTEKGAIMGTLGGAVAGVGVAAVVGQRLFGERAVRPDVGVADHGAAATSPRAGAGSGSPARTAVACGVRDVVAGEVLHAGGLAGDPARSAAGGRGSAREA